MRAFARYRLAFGLVLVAIAATALCFSQLPDLLPIHWDMHGRPPDFQPKWWAAWVVPVSAVLVTTSLAWLLTPEADVYDHHQCCRGLDELPLRRHLVCRDASIGIASSVTCLWASALLLMAVGNILGKLTWDFFVGIRTYWTVDDPDVWERTHRASGPVYVFGGLAILVASIAHAPTPHPASPASRDGPLPGDLFLDRLASRLVSTFSWQPR